MLTHSALVSPVKTESVLSPWSFSSDTTGNQISWCKDLIILKVWILRCHLARLVVCATHVLRLCSGPGFDSRPGSFCCVSLPLSYPVSCHTVQLSCLSMKPEKAKKNIGGKKSMNLNKKILCCLLRGKYLFSSGQKSGSTTWQHPGSW